MTRDRAHHPMEPEMTQMIPSQVVTLQGEKRKASDLAGARVRRDLDREIASEEAENGVDLENAIVRARAQVRKNEGQCHPRPLNEIDGQGLNRLNDTRRRVVGGRDALIVIPFIHLLFDAST